MILNIFSPFKKGREFAVKLTKHYIFRFYYVYNKGI